MQNKRREEERNKNKNKNKKQNKTKRLSMDWYQVIRRVCHE